VGDSSVFPRTLSVNPSLTIMAMATRLADHIDANESGYLSGSRQLVA
jgi:choline dehydrogenase-like flavoprotein